jgi:hypothetical protein
MVFTNVKASDFHKVLKQFYPDALNLLSNLFSENPIKSLKFFFQEINSQNVFPIRKTILNLIVELNESDSNQVQNIWTAFQYVNLSENARKVISSFYISLKNLIARNK